MREAQIEGDKVRGENTRGDEGKVKEVEKVRREICGTVGAGLGPRYPLWPSTWARSLIHTHTPRAPTALLNVRQL